jgi:hypothetical protein
VRERAFGPGRRRAQAAAGLGRAGREKKARRIAGLGRKEEKKRGKKKKREWAGPK